MYTEFQSSLTTTDASKRNYSEINNYCYLNSNQSNYGNNSGNWINRQNKTNFITPDYSRSSRIKTNKFTSITYNNQEYIITTIIYIN